MYFILWSEIQSLYYRIFAPVFFPQGPHPTVLATCWMFQSLGLGSTISPQNYVSLSKIGSVLSARCPLEEVPLLLGPVIIKPRWELSVHKVLRSIICSAGSDLEMSPQVLYVEDSPVGDTMERCLEHEGNSLTGGSVHSFHRQMDYGG